MKPVFASQKPEPMFLNASTKHLEQVAVEVKTEDKPSDSSTEIETLVEQNADAPNDKTLEQQQTDKSTDFFLLRFIQSQSARWGHA